MRSPFSRPSTPPAACWSTAFPEFRLPKAIVQSEVDKLKALGVEIMTDMVIGKVLSPLTSCSRWAIEAVFVGSGAGLPMLHEYSRRGPCRRVFRQRISDPYQSDEGLSA